MVPVKQEESNMRKITMNENNSYIFPEDIVPKKVLK